MSKASYRAIGGSDGHLANLRPFHGNTMSARTEDGKYRVYSYSTEIAWYDFDTKEKWVSNGHWSSTTSRQQNLARAWLAYKVSNVQEYAYTDLGGER